MARRILGLPADGRSAVSVPKGVSWVLDELTDAGFETVLVGGCVRDALMGIAPHDFDVATQARPEQVSAALKRPGVDVDPTGIRQGGVTVRVHGEEVEVTTYRVDGAYGDRRHCDVTFTSSLAQDLARRDFTVNAMALLPHGTGSFELVDEFGGRDDLERGLIRCVGDPRRRFGEDALRMLRALRFAARLGFALEPATHAALLAELPGVDTVSVERRTDELLRTLAAPHVEQALIACGPLVLRLVPELGDRVDGQTWHLAARTVGALTRRDDPSLLVAALLDGCANPTEALSEHLRLTASQTQRAELLLRFSPELTSFDQRGLAALGQHLAERVPSNGEVLEMLEELLQLNRARLEALAPYDGRGDDLAQIETGFATLERMKAGHACLRTRDLAIKGGEVIALGAAPGPQVGRVLQELLDQVIAGELPNEHLALGEAAQALIRRS